MKKNILFLAFILTVADINLSQTVQAQSAPAKQWDKTFSGIDTDWLKALQQTSDGGYILGGFSPSGNSGDKSQASQGMEDFWIIKVDNSGNKVWDKTFGGPGYDYLNSLQQTSDGGFILGGDSKSGIGGDKSQASRGEFDFWIIKTDAVGNKIWDKTFGGTEDDFLRSVKQTSDGGYILGGTSNSEANGDKTQTSWGHSDFWVIKLDANGNKVWDKRFGGDNLDGLNALVQTSDGGYFLGGHSGSWIGGDKSQQSFSFGNQDYWVLKINASGNKIWDKTFTANGHDVLWALQQTSDGGYILGGESQSGISGDKTEASRGGRDNWIIKLDLNGNKIWDKTFGGNEDDILQAIQQTSDGGFVIGVTSSSGNNGDKSEPFRSNGGAFAHPDYWLIRLNSVGNKIWDKTLGGVSQEVCSSLQQTSDGGYIIGGRSISGISYDKSQNSTSGDYWIIKLTPETLGVNSSNTSSSEVKIYPNPTSGIINFELDNHIPSQVRVYNALGKCVFLKELNLQQTKEELDLSHFSKGMYLLKLKTREQVICRKVIIE